ncbi:MAG: hypothetical protein OHK0013_44160 [Sandaracinaceae bacterium]
MHHHAPEEAAARLRAKYVEILALRDAHARGEDPPDLRARLRALAAAFPGALRELDRLPRETIMARLDALARCSQGAPLAAWMIAMDLVHDRLRHALAEKRDEGRAVPRPGRLWDRAIAETAVVMGLPRDEVAAMVLPGHPPPA